MRANVFDPLGRNMLFFNPLRQMILATISVLLMSGYAAAQSPDEQPRPQGSSEGPIVEESPLFLRSEKDGELHLVPNLTLEELEKARRAIEEIEGDPQPPRYVLERMDLSGTVDGEFALVKIEMNVKLLTDRWVKIPLGLHNVVIRDPPQYRGEGEQLVSFPNERDGWTWWLKGAAGPQQTSHHVIIHGVVPVVKLGMETMLRLVMPRTTILAYQIEVPTPKAAGRVSESAAPLRINFGQSGTRFSGEGMGGEFELAWTSPDRSKVRVPTSLEASSEITARVDGRSISTEARLKVRSFGGTFDQFRVRLPPGAEIVYVNHPEYDLLPVQNPTDDTTTGSRLVDIRLRERTNESPIVRLVTEQSRGLAGTGRPVDLAGFEVVGAVRQWGYLAVAAEGDWQIQWGERHNVRQIDNLPESIRSEKVVAGFEFFGQPFALPVRVMPRTTRLQVEPEYVVLLGEQRATLLGRLSYTIRGAKEFSLRMALPGWDLDTIGPANIVDSDSVLTSKDQVVTIPLSQPTTGKVEIVFQASRSVDAAAGMVDFDLPVPEASLDPASVAVLPDDNVELAPRADESLGLTSQHVELQSTLPVRQQRPLLYRGEPGPTRFAADLDVYDQKILVRIASVVTLDPSGNEVQQQLNYEVLYEPVDRLTLEAPVSVTKADKLTILFENQRLSPVVVGQEQNDEDEQGLVQFRVALPRATIGPCQLLISYPVAARELLPDQTSLETIPLVMPVDGQLDAHEMVLTPSREITISNYHGNWSEVEGELPGGKQRSLRLEGDGHASEFSFAAQLSEPTAADATNISQAWVQSWITETGRQDRACFRLTTSEDVLRIELPTNVDPEDVEVRVDGSLSAPQSSESGLAIPIAALSGGQQHRLELRYQIPDQGEMSGPLVLNAPKFDGDVRIGDIYWQVVLPRSKHLISEPLGFFHEYTWGWQGFYFGRRPLHDQTYLETWSGALTGTRVPQSANQYLFRCFNVRQGPRPLELQVTGRGTIVFWIAAAAFLAGIFLLYVPAGRQPWLFLVSGIAVLSFAATFPEPALLVGQAAVVGLVLVQAAAVLKYLLADREARYHVPPGPAGSSVVASGRISTESYYREPSHSSSAATTTAMHSTDYEQ